ncbi:MAG: MarR family transcriptional regulator [Clostridia bacterium]|nr:MarR family transcriptional regulator [Clostridia bacterium]
MEKTISFELRFINNQIKRRINSIPTLQNNDIKGIYGHVIGFLSENSNRDIYQKDVEEHLSIRRSSVTNLLNQMEKAGLIERRSVDGDGRLKKVVLTQKSIDIHDCIVGEFKKIEVKLREGISEEELDTLFRLLDKVKNNVEKQQI